MTATPEAHRPGLDEPVPYTLTPRGHAALTVGPRPAGADGYVIPMCPGDDPGADWREMGWDSHANAALAHIAWCPNHPGYWPDGPAVMWESFLRQLDPDEPVPYTLTPKARAFLDRIALAADTADAILALESSLTGAPATVDGAGGWACGQCGDGRFGPMPDDGRCPGCRDNS